MIPKSAMEGKDTRTIACSTSNGIPHGAIWDGVWLKPPQRGRLGLTGGLAGC